MRTGKPDKVLGLRSVLTALVVGLLFASATTGKADGKVFAPVLVPQQVEMPDQRALVAWNEGIETLVIESAFVGKGTDFAWVVPLPSKPEVFPATRGTLPAAAALMQPTVEQPWSAAWMLTIVLGGIGLTALAFGWSTVGKGMRVGIVLSCLAILSLILGAATESAVIAWSAMAVGCACLWPLRNWFREEDTMIQTLVALAIGFLVVASIFLPTLGTVKSAVAGVTTTGTVTVERQQVGDYDVAIISGREGEGVTAWLDANGFALDDAVRKVAEDHATAGGWFVASRVRRAFSESGRSVPAPLAFRFPVEQAVYPMRLTGAGAERPLAVELIVCGPSEASVTGLIARTVAPLTHGEPKANGLRWGGRQSREGRTISHPELIRWTQDTSVATWLRGELAPDQMQADLTIRWTKGDKAKGLSVLTTEDAWGRASLLGGTLGFIGAMVLGLLHGNGRPPRRPAGVVVLLALTVTGAFRVLTPTIAAEHLKAGIPWYELAEIPTAAAMALFALPSDADDEAVNAAFAKALVDFTKDYDRSELRIGDAPGEVMLHKLPDGSWRVWFFNAYGQPDFFPGTDMPVGR